MTRDDFMRMSVGDLLTMLGSQPKADADPWVDPKCCKEAAFRELLNAGKRGELALSKVGRRYLVRRSELDRWIALQRVNGDMRQPTAAGSSVAHILEAHGFKKVGGR